MFRPLTGIQADQGQSYYSIEEIASSLRESLGLGPLDEFDALGFFHDALPDLELTAGGRTIQVVEGIETCAPHGLTRWDVATSKLEVILSDSTYAQLLTGHVRARSTVAHETGHAILHTAQIVRLAGLGLASQVAFHRDRTPHRACFDTEWQANAFASALLMPAAGVRAMQEERRLSVSEIAKTFRVSEESAGYRLESFWRSLGLK
jgi:hypothetical protein